MCYLIFVIFNVLNLYFYFKFICVFYFLFLYFILFCSLIIQIFIITIMHHHRRKHHHVIKRTEPMFTGNVARVKPSWTNFHWKWRTGETEPNECSLEMTHGWNRTEPIFQFLLVLHHWFCSLLLKTATIMNRNPY